MDKLEIFKNVTDLVTLDKEQIELITKRLPEYFRVKSMIGHSTSQASYTLQTMNMISDSPMSRMKQCMAQVRKKYSALSEAYFSVEKKKLRIKKLLKKENEFSELEARKLTSEISDISVSMENSLREIGLMQDLYDSIKKKNNISDEWNEKVQNWADDHAAMIKRYEALLRYREMQNFAQELTPDEMHQFYSLEGIPRDSPEGWLRDDIDFEDWPD